MAIALRYYVSTQTGGHLVLHIEIYIILGATATRLTYDVGTGIFDHKYLIYIGHCTRWLSHAFRHSSQNHQMSNIHLQ